MREVDIVEHVKSGGHLKLWHLTDLHVGAPDFAEKELRYAVSLIEQDPCARWTFGGDGGDLIRHTDRRYKPDELHHRYRNAIDIRYATAEHLLELFDPIRLKCLAWADGNHEEVFDKMYGGKFGCEMATNLGIADRWVDYRGFVKVQVQITKTQRLPLFIDIQHGWQAGRRPGAAHNQLELEMGYTDADVLLRGHSHAPLAHPMQTWTMTNGSSAYQRQRYLINGGSWRRGYTRPKAVNPNRLSEVEGSLWSERKGFRVGDVGGPVLRIGVRAQSGRNRPLDPVMPAHFEMTAYEGTINEEVLGL